MNIQVKYTPGAADPWSQAPASKIVVTPGQTELDWSIQVIPASAGTIVFSSDPPGIQFTGTGNSAWPGSPPTADGSDIKSTINNTLPSGSSSAKFHYRVNAVYTPANGTGTQVTWDPEVEEDPPHVALK